jgi:VWFA-related protein
MHARLTLALSAAALTAAASVLVSAQSKELAMYVSVLDRNGAPVMDLRPDEFVIRENGVRREVLRASRATQPLDVAAIVDNSQASAEFTQDLREGVRTFVRLIGGSNRMAVISAGERPTVLQDYTNDPAALQKGVDRLFTLPGSGSYVLQAIIDVSNGIQKREPERPAIVAIATDGPEFSERMHDLVLEPLKRSGASLHVLFVQQQGGAGDHTSDSARERGLVFDEGTRATGGRYDNVLAPQALTGKLTQVANELTNQYIVTYARPAALIPPDQFEVTATRPGLTVRGIAVKSRGGKS